MIDFHRAFRCPSLPRDLDVHELVASRTPAPARWPWTGPGDPRDPKGKPRGNHGEMAETMGKTMENAMEMGKTLGNAMENGDFP